MSEIDYANISPYTDEQAVEALHKVARNPMLPVISKFLFPDEPFYSLHRMLKSINSIDEFQEVVMSKMVVADVQRTSSGFTYEGIEHLDTGKTFLAVSNHRDIILDPALIQWTLFHNKMPLTEICVGSNLLEGNKIVADLLRSNRMIKVIRGISARELYLSSKLLSSYIRSRVASGEASVWVAQREGRTKNGIDLTEQGLLKMFDMSGTKGFKENFMELNITPMSISYEYESCDMKKARELYLSKDRKYVKKRTEDLHSIMTGIKQWKGRIHLSIDTPLTEEEIERASICDKNDRYQYIRHVLDYRIVKLYKLWKTNYMGYDLMNRTTKYSSLYGKDDLEAFKAYTEHKLSKVERNLDRDALRQLFWEIYGNPVARKEELCPID
ncbi:MAG: 1-acyl-sn-glycerol-3-phosphate acyltransferase [Candidatus Cryptobacteroides sp.]|nr:1-acyl-sn-glycerol-3-phosphate acyltransferase [Bacteroidales bacterium]